MVELYGRSKSRRDVCARAGMLSQFAGVRLVELADGVERGVRMLEFRTGTGLRFTVLVDRALDIAECEHNGRAKCFETGSAVRFSELVAGSTPPDRAPMPMRVKIP